MRVDLHIHTKYSKDCRLEPRDILRVASTRVDAIAVTDHDTIKGGVETKKLEGEFGIEVVIGAEIRTDRGEVLGYGLEEEISQRDFFEVVDAIRDQGGLVAIPHPFDFLRVSSLTIEGDILKAIDAVEVFNSRCVLASFNEKARSFAEEHGLAITAGSDAHTLNELGRAGLVLDSLDLSPEALRDARLFGEKTSPGELLKTKFNKVFRRRGTP